MKKWQQALVWLVATVLLAVSAGYLLNVYRARHFTRLKATVLEERSEIVGLSDRLFGPPSPIIQTTILLAYTVNGNEYTGEIRTARSGSFLKGTKVNIICNTRNPRFIDLNE